MSSNNREQIPKMLIVSLITIFISIIVFTFFDDMGAGFNFKIYHGSGQNYNSLLVSTLVYAVKILWLVFIVSLSIGFILFMKKYLFSEKRNSSGMTIKEEGYACPCCGTILTADFKFCPKCKASLNDICAQCGKELQVGWNSCPWCGTKRNSQS